MGTYRHEPPEQSRWTLGKEPTTRRQFEKSEGMVGNTSWNTTTISYNTSSFETDLVFESCFNCGSEMDATLYSWSNSNTIFNSFNHVCDKDWSLGFVMAPSVETYTTASLKGRGWRLPLPQGVERTVRTAVCGSSLSTTGYLQAPRSLGITVAITA